MSFSSRALDMSLMQEILVPNLGGGTSLVREGASNSIGA